VTAGGARSTGFRVGDWVRLTGRPPWTDQMPLETRRVIDHCVGKIFRIDDLAPGDLYVLDVSAEVDARFGGFANDLRVESDYLEPAAPPT
jgi:hypothetical protein